MNKQQRTHTEPVSNTNCSEKHYTQATAAAKVTVTAVTETATARYRSSTHCTQPNFSLQKHLLQLLPAALVDSARIYTAPVAVSPLIAHGDTMRGYYTITK